MNARERATAITQKLSEVYPDRRPLLDYASAYELLISVILSAQTTDAQVNRVTPELFRRYPSPGALASATQEEVEELVHSTGFYRNKAKNVIAAARRIHDDFGDEVPFTMDELVTIPGMGRKSANVILGVIYGQPSIVVDTHLTRVTNRMGFVHGKNAVKIERELRVIVRPEHQTDFSMAVNLHGRYRCYARNPNCKECEIFDLCAWPEREERAREIRAAERGAPG